MLNDLLKKLIKTGTGRFRFIMATAGMSVAMLLILLSMQLQSNYQELLYGKTNQDSIANFLLINKVVTNETIGATSLSEDEISDLKKQPFVEAIGVLTPSRFKISAQSVSNQIPFYTDLFFESVPDAFLDIQTKDWNWNEQSNFIPMIIPNSFLDMYNFGFATSRSLPQLSQDLVKNLPIQINIRSADGRVDYYGKVVGFSDRISSILVPQSFMDWANAKYGEGSTGLPSRVVIKTNDPGNPRLTDYLQAHGLTTDKDKTRFSKYREVISVVVNISWITGAILFLFALLVFTLFIQLTIASCKDEIHLLLTLGASPKQLRQFLMRHFFPVNFIIIALALILLSLIQYFAANAISVQHIYISHFISIYTILAALLLLIILWFVNSQQINQHLRSGMG
ncbi:MAG: hypothetical protein JSS67_06435 [Bacteroidetes bacterium]|nr:hypothetical protein [Bacteroidota bacterium]